MHPSCIRDINAFWILINDIPAALFPIRWDMAIFNILENPLVEIANVVIIGLVPLAENFIAYNLLP